MKEILDRVLTWPPEAQAELVEAAREIEARQTDVHVLSDDEKAAIADALKSDILSDDEMKDFWRRRGVA